MYGKRNTLARRTGRRMSKTGRVLTLFLGLAIGLALVLAALLVGPLPAMPQPGVAGDFLIRNVAIVDVSSGAVIPGRDIVVRDGRIDSISAGTAGTGQDDLLVVDGTGKFAIPGLWDMHVHSLKISPQYTHPLSIANGVTGVREMWGCASLPDGFVACGEDIERWREGLKIGRHLAPRYIQRSSFAINGAGGVPAAAPAFFRARNADEARALVAHHAGAGVDLLKTYTNLSPDAYAALAVEAPMHGLFLAGHLPVRRTGVRVDFFQMPGRLRLSAKQRSESTFSGRYSGQSGLPPLSQPRIGPRPWCAVYAWPPVGVGFRTESALDFISS